jgi:methyltransferase-like protein/tRNA G46 methylase TrmB
MTPTAYEKVLYPTRVFPQTDPNRLAAIGFLRGMLPAPIESCRVLELGCGAGSNLIGMAFRLPASEFVGLDLAQRPIASGGRFTSELGLRNIVLHSMDLTEADAGRFGSFDFIIAHGLYSWVPEAVRERILAICREMLNPNGIAYISYNAYPGNHFRDLVRGMMRFHSARFEAPAEKISQARGLLQFLANSQTVPDYYAEAIRTEFERVVNCPDAVLFHDDLSEVNQPFYFYEFMEDAERHGLQFVGEARTSELVWKEYTPEVRDRIRELEAANEIVREQFKDFLRGWSFRQTVLCHKEIQLSPGLLPQRIPKLYAMCDATPVQQAEYRHNLAAVFRRPTGAELEIEQEPISAALKLLCSKWPGSASFPELREAARTTGESAFEADDEAVLANELIRAHKMGFVHWHVARHNVAGQIEERPAISELARFQLQQGDCATSQIHTSVDFPDRLERHFALLLDSTRDRRALVQELTEFVKSNRGTLYQNGILVEEPGEIETILGQQVLKNLERLRREAMLVPTCPGLPRRSTLKGMGTAEGLPTTYDKVLYPAATYPQTHPTRLAAAAFLRGMHPSPVDRCRVLELGCGSGSNLIAMAFHLPESEFVGVDLAQRPIASGIAAIAELSLGNINLHAIDLLAVKPEDFGRFDFIIAHGLYSWVPQPAREHVLTICREMLNPDGIAYISYNAYPGNYLRDLVRGMMRFHTACFDDPVEVVGQARGLLKFLAQSKVKPDYYVAAIQAQFERTLKYADAAFFHDDLSDVNQPFYFYQFMEQAEGHGLKFLGEAGPNELDWEKFTPEVAKKMGELAGASEIVREQYKDFIRGCAFRQTLLCRQEKQLSPEPLIERVRALHVMCNAIPVESTENDGKIATTFHRRGGAELVTSLPLVSAALKALSEQQPCSISFQTLLQTARTGAGTASTAILEDETTLATALIKAYQAGFVELYSIPFRVTNQVGDRPAVGKLARFQLSSGEFAVNQLHTSLRFPDPVSRQLILLLDGTRDENMLVRELIEFVRSGRGNLYENNVLVENPDKIATTLKQRVQEGLNSLAQEGMLLK